MTKINRFYLRKKLQLGISEANSSFCRFNHLKLCVTPNKLLFLDYEIHNINNKYVTYEKALEIINVQPCWLYERSAQLGY